MEGIDKNTFKRIFHDHWDAFKQESYDGQTVSYWPHLCVPAQVFAGTGGIVITKPDSSSMKPFLPSNSSDEWYSTSCQRAFREFAQYGLHCFSEFVQPMNSRA